MSETGPMRRSFVPPSMLVAGSAVSPIAHRGLGLVDLSLLPRWGVKGKEAFRYLASHGATAPAENNRATRQPDGTMVARLSPAEALVLSSPGEGRSLLGSAIEALPPEGQVACYPVPRQDSHAWFAVTGGAAPRMFAKLCGVDLAADQFLDGAIAQTSVARLSAIVIRHDVQQRLTFSILAESASAEYLWACLLDAMTEFSDAVVDRSVFSKRMA